MPTWRQIRGSEALPIKSDVFCMVAVGPKLKLRRLMHVWSRLPPPLRSYVLMYLTCDTARTLGVASRALGQDVRHSLPALAKQVHFYVCGGKSRSARGDCLQSSDDAKRFDPIAGRWERLPPMSECRGGNAVAALGGKIYVCGGVDYKRNQVLKSVECFDPHLWKWEAVPNMSSERADAAAVAVSGMLFVIGGEINCKVLRTGEYYDPESREWLMVRKPMYFKRCLHGMAVSPKGIYAVGGCTCTEDTWIRTAEMYHFETSRWDLLPAMPIKCVWPQVTRVGHGLIVCEAVVSSAQKASFMLTYDVITGGPWNELRMECKLWAGNATAFSGGNLYVFDSISKENDRVLRYDLQKHTFDDFDALDLRPAARMFAGAAVVSK